jgi:ribA/ribD-fused uncharacterized protein
MKKKQELFDPENIGLSELIMTSSDPAKIKKYGRMVKHYQESVWENERYEIMKESVYLKFSQNENLSRILLETNNCNLYEASPYDKLWGIGIGVKDAVKGMEHRGRNLLGKILMEVRSML